MYAYLCELLNAVFIAYSQALFMWYFVFRHTKLYRSFSVFHFKTYSNGFVTVYYSVIVPMYLQAHCNKMARQCTCKCTSYLHIHIIW